MKNRTVMLNNTSVLSVIRRDVNDTAKLLRLIYNNLDRTCFTFAQLEYYDSTPLMEFLHDIENVLETAEQVTSSIEFNDELARFTWGEVK